jgi:hypothetical protein
MPRRKRLTLVEDVEPDMPNVTIAPLTVTANPKQTALLWKFGGPAWSDAATGWRGLWATLTYRSTNRVCAVRLRVVDDWPVLPWDEFDEVLEAAMEGRRLPTLAEDEQVREQLAGAPIGPVEGMRSTVAAQIRAISPR